MSDKSRLFGLTSQRRVYVCIQELKVRGARARDTRGTLLVCGGAAERTSRCEADQRGCVRGHDARVVRTDRTR